MEKGFTFDELVAKKIQRDADREKVAEFDIGGKTLKFRKPKEKELFSIMDEVSGAVGMGEAVRATDKIIYICCPALQDEALHKAIDIIDPYNVPAALFDIVERQELGERLFDFCGLGDMEEEIKNE